MANIIPNEGRVILYRDDAHVELRKEKKTKGWRVDVLVDGEEYAVGRKLSKDDADTLFNDFLTELFTYSICVLVEQF